MEREILVDGYNVIKNNEMFCALEIRNRAEARKLLIRQLHYRYRFEGCRITVVFDGDGVREQTSHEEHIRVIFSRHGETADSVIARLAIEAHASGRAVEMYSNDTEVRQSVIEQGGTARSVRQLVTHLNAAPSDVAYRILYRQEMRKMYGIDPAHKAEDEIEYRQGKGAGKRKKRKRPY